MPLNIIIRKGKTSIPKSVIREVNDIASEWEKRNREHTKKQCVDEASHLAENRDRSAPCRHIGTVPISTFNNIIANTKDPVFWQDRKNVNQYFREHSKLKGD